MNTFLGFLQKKVINHNKLESGKSFSKKVFYYLLFQQERLVHKLTTFFEKLSQNVKKSTSWFSRLNQLFKVGN